MAQRIVVIGGGAAGIGAAGATKATDPAADVRVYPARDVRLDPAVGQVRGAGLVAGFLDHRPGLVAPLAWSCLLFLTIHHLYDS